MTILFLVDLRESPLLPVSDGIPATARHTPKEVLVGRPRRRSGGGSLARVARRNMPSASAVAWHGPPVPGGPPGVPETGREVMVTPVGFLLSVRSLCGSQEQSSAIQTKTPRALPHATGPFSKLVGKLLVTRGTDPSRDPSLSFHVIQFGDLRNKANRNREGKFSWGAPRCGPSLLVICGECVVERLADVRLPDARDFGNS